MAPQKRVFATEAPVFFFCLNFFFESYTSENMTMDLELLAHQRG